MRSGRRNAAVRVVVPGGAVSERATLRAEIRGATRSPALRVAGCTTPRLTTPIVVAASIDPVSQSSAGSDDNTDSVPSTAAESPLA